MTDPVTIESNIPVPPQAAWNAYTDPASIMQWNFASPDWCCPNAKVDLREGGRHLARMEARDGSMGFDFEGTYEVVDAPNALVMKLDHGRMSHTTFEAADSGTRVRIVFDPEPTNPVEMQRDGWQSILDNYAAHVTGATS